VIIIDEYDTPIQEGYAKDFYDNKNLSFGFLIGILRIVQESIFSGMNNLTILLWTKNMTVSLDLPVQKYMR
ncbi:MAG: hypothetical protein SPF46_04835, partial [Blautia sp.]|nr:hypothetical protein [Blautia sp.]